jgi:hypothetical protein
VVTERAADAVAKKGEACSSVHLTCIRLVSLTSPSEAADPVGTSLQRTSPTRHAACGTTGSVNGTAQAQALRQGTDLVGGHTDELAESPGTYRVRLAR